MGLGQSFRKGASWSKSTKTRFFLPQNISSYCSVRFLKRGSQHGLLLDSYLGTTTCSSTQHFYPCLCHSSKKNTLLLRDALLQARSSHFPTAQVSAPHSRDSHLALTKSIKMLPQCYKVQGPSPGPLRPAASALGPHSTVKTQLSDLRTPTCPAWTTTQANTGAHGGLHSLLEPRICSVLVSESIPVGDLMFPQDNHPRKKAWQFSFITKNL